MNVKICPTCGCSLVRLGITDEQAVEAAYNEIVYFFCCQGCADIFQKQPERFVEEVRDIHVCPACLADKPTAYTVPYCTTGRKFVSVAAPIAQRFLQKIQTSILIA